MVSGFVIWSKPACNLYLTFRFDTQRYRQLEPICQMASYAEMLDVEEGKQRLQLQKFWIVNSFVLDQYMQQLNFGS